MILSFTAGRVAWMAAPLFMMRRCRLELDHEGIHVRMLVRHEVWRWRDIDEFATGGLDHGPVPMVRFVGVNFRTAPPKLPAAAALMKRMNGYHRSLPAWFGDLNADERAVPLERSRQDYSGHPGRGEDRT